MSNDRDFLYRLAVMYYSDGLTQQEISERLGISRPQISRALSRAEQEGIVRIEVVQPTSEKQHLEQRIAALLGIERVFLAGQLVRMGSDRERRNQNIALAAARILPELFEGKANVGIGWGDTVYRTALSLDYADSTTETCFVPLIGSLGMRESRYQVNSIVDRMAEKMRGQVLYFNAPAFAIDAQTREKTLHQEPFFSLLDTWKHLNVAVIGLGVSVEHAGFPFGEFASENIERLRSSKAVGDILGQFFDADGNICQSGYEQEYLGFSLSELREVDQTICLCGGTPKIPGMIAAARRGYYNMLVTDERTGIELIEVLEG
jgi:DNA-binding transcriptional regulator LsrR (DeoR family)